MASLLRHLKEHLFKVLVEVLLLFDDAMLSKYFGTSENVIFHSTEMSL